MNHKKLLIFHSTFAYTYFVTIATNYRYNSTIPIYKKFRQYIYNHDKNSHIFSVKEYTEKFHDEVQSTDPVQAYYQARGLHYHILVFTNKKLNYSRVHKRMPLHSDINIQLVPKTESDIKKVLAYMLKNQIN